MSQEASSGTAPRAGWHWIEWLCEFAGTAFLVFAGLSAVCLDFGTGSPVDRLVPDPSIRLLITGLLFAGSGSLVAISPLGRRSGGHINPAVTVAFWLTGHVHRHDLVGFVLAQCLGAIAGAAILDLIWGPVAISVNHGRTSPGSGTSVVAACALEAAMTAALLGTIFVFVSRRRLMRLTPLAIWILVAVLVWRGAPYTGTSLNPARSLGPAVVAGEYDDLWIYLLSPLVAAVLVGGGTRLLAAHQRLLTARLFEDPSYPSVVRRLDRLTGSAPGAEPTHSHGAA